jgi:FtsP/CotA-like multicopper oxidase with cupredoxin domain
MNVLRHPNTTNIHTHGLHVSSMAPGDDPFQIIAPGSELTSHFQIPAYHMGGTHWYHPHHHGSTALQAGGGAAGVFIVEDQPGEVPEEIRTMEERVMMWTVLDLSTLAAVQGLFNDALWTVGGSGDAAATIMLVNGQSRPEVAVEAGKWYRWRMVFSALGSASVLSFAPGSDGATCELQLLAKDGVYLPLAPRAIDRVHLYPGARADVVSSKSWPLRITSIALLLEQCDAHCSSSWHDIC